MQKSLSKRLPAMNYAVHLVQAMSDFHKYTPNKSLFKDSLSYNNLDRNENDNPQIIISTLVKLNIDNHFKDSCKTSATITDDFTCTNA